MKIFTIIISFFLTVTSITSGAQNKSLKLNFDPKDTRFYNAGKNGILIYHEQKITKRHREYIQMNYQLVDTNLEVVSSKVYLRPLTETMVASYFSEIDNSLYFITGNFFKAHHFNLIYFDYNSNNLKRKKGILLKEFWLKNLYVSNHYAFVTENFKENKFLIINTRNGRKERIKINWEKSAVEYKYVEDIFSKTSFMIYLNTLQSGKLEYKMVNLRAPENSFLLQVPKKVSLGSVMPSLVDPNTMIVAGTYSDRPRPKAADANAAKSMPQNDPRMLGFYFTKIREGKKSEIQFLPEESINIEDDESDDEEDNFDLEIKANVHAPIKIGDQYFIIADMYELHYTQVEAKNGWAKSKFLKSVKSLYTKVIAMNDLGEIVWEDTLKATKDIGNFWTGGNQYTKIERSETDGSYRIYYINEQGLKCKKITLAKLEDVSLVQEGKLTKEVKDNLFYLNNSICLAYIIYERSGKLVLIKYR